MYLSLNSNAIQLLKDNLDKIDWKILSLNPNAIQLLEANQDKIWWNLLSKNPNAIHLLEANQNKLNLNFLFQNNNIKAIDLINNNLHKMNDTQYYNKIFGNPIMRNPNVLSVILKWDYNKIKTHFYSTFGKELIEWIYNPIRYEKWDKTCWDFDVI